MDIVNASEASISVKEELRGILETVTMELGNWESRVRSIGMFSCSERGTVGGKYDGAGSFV